MASDDLTYPKGLKGLMERYNSRRTPFVFYKEDLPPIDVDLRTLTTTTVPASATGPQPGEPRKHSSWAAKRREIAKEFVGESELAFLNAMLISNLRKTQAPPQAAALFLRIWKEEHAHLIDALDLRWKVSSIMTFAEHGETDVQRQVGHAMTMLFGLMKLYEFERLYSGLRPVTPHRFARKAKAPLPMEMESFSIRNGGLDAKLLAPVWELALTDPGIAPLANHLMEELNRDPGTLFRRLKAMKHRLRKRATKT